MKLIINYKSPIYNSDNRIAGFELKNKYNILLNDEKSGGDIFDNINLDDIIIKKETKNDIVDNISNINKNYGEIDNSIINKYKIKKNIIKKSQITEYIINYNFSIYNSIYNIKLLIYYFLKIPIENQNLFCNKDHELFYNYINNITNESIDINMQNINNMLNLKYYNYLPIDFDLINNRINYTIDSHEKNKYIDKLNLKNTEILLELDLIVLDDFIIKFQKDSIYREINKDDELLMIIYRGFIEKYFPYYTINLFLLYLTNDKKSLEFPELNIKYDSINLINNKINEINSKKFQKELISYSKIINKYYKKLTYYIPSYNKSKILNIKELFNNIELKKHNNIKKIELQLEIQNKLIFFSKHNTYSQNQKLNENNIPFINNNFKSTSGLYINNKLYNSLLGSSYLSNNILFIVYSITNVEIPFEIYIIINEVFDVYVIYNIYEYINISEKPLIKYKKEIIKYINELFQSLFINGIIKKNKIINDYNIELLLLDSQVEINKNININVFNKIYTDFAKYELLNYYKIVNYDEINNVIELINHKIDYDNIKINKLKELTNNFYNFYTNNDLIEKYNKIIYFSKIVINNKIKNIKIDIINIKNTEFDDILELIYNLLFTFLKINSNDKNNNDSYKLKNKLKRLKDIDPILYSINKRNTKNLYSRKCQSSQQPDIINKKDLKKYKNYIEYINFTSGEPIYYTCNNKKFPTVKFLTNLHPMNYCIPCCKKKAIEDVKIKSKYTAIHNECLTSYKYDKKNKIIDEKSRYIMNYSSKIVIENLRLMQIPDDLIKLFNKMYEDDGDGKLKYYIYGINQDIGNMAYIGIFNIISFILNKSISDTIEVVKKIFINDKQIFYNILNGILPKEFDSLNNFIITFTNIFQDSILLPDLNYEFNKWNILFLEILKYLNYITIIFEESDSGLQLLVPENINSINEYIYINENYNYIILIKRNIQNKDLYYPIIKTNYSEYYSKSIFYNKSYNYNSQIINLISEIIKSQINKSNDSLNLQLIEQFILENKEWKIDSYFINFKNEIYSILLKYLNKHFIYLNINKQKILNNSFYLNNLSNNIRQIDRNNYGLYKSNYIDINKYNIQLNNIFIFIRDLNNYIYSINKTHYSELYYKSFVNLIDKQKLKILDTNNIENDNLTTDNKLYNYIYLSNFIIHNNKIIGIEINTNNKTYNMYINKPLNQDIGKNIIKSKSNEIVKIIKKPKLSKDLIKKIMTREILNFEYSTINYIYNPHDINNIIYNNQFIKDRRVKLLNEALYHTNLYNLFLIHCSNKIFKLKNMLIRTKIKNLISNMDKQDIELILSNNYNKITDILTKYIINANMANDMELQILYNFKDFIKNIISKFIKNNRLNSNVIKELKKFIIYNIDDNMFLFDNITIYNIINLEKKEAIKELDNIIHSEITFTNTNQSMPITLELCENSNTSYNCKNNKLIMSKETYYKFLDIYYYDLINPFKQKLILNLLNYNLNNIYQFKQFNNEQIYIYF